VAGLVLCLAVAAAVVVVVVVVRQPQQAVLPHGPGQGSTRSADADPDDVRADAASGLVERLASRLESGSSQQVATLAAANDPRAARELTTLRDNVRRIGITGLTMRYVDDKEGALSADQQHEFGNRAWVVQVQMAWRIGGYDLHDSRMEVPLVLRQQGSRAGFVTARPGFGDARPLWMLGPVTVRRTARSLVLTARHSRLDSTSRLADHAVADVRKVLRRWRGRLVVEVPSNQHSLTRVLGSEPGAYSEIAAVTTTVDGTLAPDTPVHIFVNPRVFDPLGAHGSQIVMSHEATHVAMRAAFSSMPTWLLEGFADYVALAHVNLPVSVTASQILAQVRKTGTPTHLPGQAEFDPRNKALGATYESAWLACRLLAHQYSERRLIAFYRASDRASSTVGPFRSVLGTDQRAFTRLWRDDLSRLAAGAAG
jgi:hypothetical protein